VASDRTILWDGKSGKEYKYWIFEIGHSLKQVPGNYCFAKETESHKWTPIYFGETGDLSERFDNHHKMPCIRQERATHIHAHESSANKETRLAEEADLVGRWHPKCND